MIIWFYNQNVLLLLLQVLLLSVFVAKRRKSTNYHLTKEMLFVHRHSEDINEQRSAKLLGTVYLLLVSGLISKHEARCCECTKFVKTCQAGASALSIAPTSALF